MKKIGIVYGSSSGNTENVAKLIQKAFGADADVVDVAQASVDKLNEYSYLILGTSTWGVGDLQDDWDGFAGQLKQVSWDGKKVAFFGLGDSASYSDSFVDGMGILYDEVKDKAQVVGKVSSADYSYDSSRAEDGGMFVGLAIDEDNESDKTDERIAAWVEGLKNEFA